MPGRPLRGRRTHPGTRWTGYRPSRASDISGLTGRAKIDVFVEMVDTDPVIRRNWRLLQQTLLSAEYVYEPSGSGPLATKLAEYAREVIGIGGGPCMLRRSWETILAERLLYVLHGFRYGELVWRNAKSPTTGEWRTWLTDVLDCDPSAHDKWDMPDGRTLRGVVQASVPGQHGPTGLMGQTYCEVEKLWLLTLDKVGSDPEGLGLLRSAYTWWKGGKLTAEMTMIAIERFALPVIQITTDLESAKNQGIDQPLPGADGPAPPTRFDQMVEDAEDQAANFAADEAGWIKDNVAARMAPFGAKDKLDLSGLIAFLDAADHRKSAAFLAGFMQLGVSDVGSRAVGQVHESMFRRSCINVLDQVCATFDEQVMRQAIGFSFGPSAVPHAPRLKHKGLDVDALAEALPVLPDLYREGFIPDWARPQIAEQVLRHLGINTHGQSLGVSPPKLTPTGGGA